MSPTFRAFKVRNFRLYATGAIISNTGTWMQRVAQDWLVLELTHSGTALGIVTGLQFLPALLISPYAGLIADRFPKRRVLTVTQLAMGTVALVLGTLAVTGLVQAWHVFALAFVFGIGTAFDAPTRQSFVVEMVGKDDLSNAVGLNSASFNAARLIGPGLAGLLIAWIGTGPVIMINGFSYAAVILSLYLMRPDELHTPKMAGREKGMIRDGMRYLWRRPDLMMVLVAVFFAGTFGLNFQMTSALMATSAFGKGAGEYGILGSILAIGSLAGALLAARRVRTRGRLVIGAALAFGAMDIASGLMPSYLSFAAVLPLVGFTALTMLTAANATMQLGIEPTMRGRVMALYMTVLMGGTPIGSPFIGWVGQEFGARWSLIVGGGLTMLGVTGSVLYFSRRQGLAIRPRLLPRPRLEVFPQTELLADKAAVGVAPRVA
ncbi:putative MFS family arabinose efflux permease [Kribbella orskensis]|uniref:MFS family arabinose efflux permease n=1 Tax=Kribbella orskensis TaxID=2512216 RepID=A0ABY2BIF9_9ACTN|nr:MULTISPECIES: MFS transporter [Kribbella]TCN38911.1 putative MFS family arabinose efflux permease [Kribbella sp. VKM Ac-2500]TCO21092.1 putative MFS family arabinose efflux permease [Kribbella orskensis]